jgi:hypothetical protein
VELASFDSAVAPTPQLSHRIFWRLLGPCPRPGHLYRPLHEAGRDRLRDPDRDLGLVALGADLPRDVGLPIDKASPPRPDESVQPRPEHLGPAGLHLRRWMNPDPSSLRVRSSLLPPAPQPPGEQQQERGGEHPQGDWKKTRQEVQDLVQHPPEGCPGILEEILEPLR